MSMIRGHGTLLVMNSVNPPSLEECKLHVIWLLSGGHLTSFICTCTQIQCRKMKCVWYLYTPLQDLNGLRQKTSRWWNVFPHTTYASWFYMCPMVPEPLSLSHFTILSVSLLSLQVSLCCRDWESALLCQEEKEQKRREGGTKVIIYKKRKK
jgi:hypothetical protein